MCVYLISDPLDATESMDCNDFLCVGGRYDNLVKLEAPEEKEVPCVGFSFNLDRIIPMIEKVTKLRTTEIEVYVASDKSNLLNERLRMCKELWDSRIKVSTLAISMFACLRQIGKI